jgi:hypothetical protein
MVFALDPVQVNLQKYVYIDGTLQMEVKIELKFFVSY